MRLAAGHIAVVTTLRPSDQPCGDGPGFGTAGHWPDLLATCHMSLGRAEGIPTDLEICTRLLCEAGGGGCGVAVL